MAVQGELALPGVPALRRDGPGLFLVLGIDPGMEAGWGLVTLGLTPARVASGFIKNNERDPMAVFTRTAPILAAAGDYRLAVAVEDMPSMLFKSRAAGESFVISRSRWRDALIATGRLVAPPVDLVVQRWRRVCAIDARARRMERVVIKNAKDGYGGRRTIEKLDYKHAAIRWALDTLHHETRNANEAEALGIAYALARLIALREVDFADAGHDPPGIVGGCAPQKRGPRPRVPGRAARGRSG